MKNFGFMFGLSGFPSSAFRT